MAAGGNAASSEPLTEETTPAKRLRFTISSNHHPLMLPGDALPAPPDSIPMDLTIEILARIPVKSLLRFRCVCNSWNALISDPEFAKKQFRTSGKDPTRRHLVVTSFQPLSHKSPLTDYSLPSVFNSSSSSLPYRRPYEKEEEDNTFYEMVGSCHGLLCLTTSQAPAILLNPSTGMRRNLPHVNLPANHSVVMYGFGYDHLSDSYKVAAAFSYRNSGTDHIYESVFMVHTLGTDSWRLIPNYPADISRAVRYGRFVSGTLNWLGEYRNRNRISQRIVSLDLGTETFQILLPPRHLVTVIVATQVLKGCLCIVAHHRVSRFVNIWVMKDYGNNESWTKLHRVPFGTGYFQGDNLLPKPLYISDEDDEILLNFQYDLAVYNSKSRTFKAPQIQKCPYFKYIYGEVYAESLISPCF